MKSFQLFLTLILTMTSSNCFAATSWKFEQPNKETCQTISSEGLGFRLHQSGGYTIAFFDLELAGNEYGKKLLEDGEARAVIHTPKDYSYATNLKVFGNTNKNGKLVHVIGYNSSDFKLVESLKHSKVLQIKFSEDTSLIFQDNVGEPDIEYNLAGSNKAINTVMDCFR